jgi:hypothetical protein
MSLRDTILQADDLTEEPLHIPEWGCSVLVRSLPGSDRAELLQHNLLPNGKPNLKTLYPMLAIVSMRDPETKDLIFQKTDRDALAAKSGAALERVAQVAMRLNGFLPEQMKATEEAF